jgi:hypothetical protein
MKVYSFPEGITVPVLDFTKIDLPALHAAEQEATRQAAEALREQGYTGENTGEEFSIPHADGAARYMVAEGPPGSRVFALVHLPYGDKWDSPYSRRVTKKDVLASIARRRNLPSIFGAVG